MIIKEYRVILPISVKEYEVAQLWSVAEASKNETGGGEGIEILNNEPYEKDGEQGQYTKKIYHLESRVPKFLRMLAPKGSLEFHEEAWNAYPKCKTVITNPGYMKDNFEACIKTIHLPDLGTSENVHNLSESEWKNTTVVKIDIANDHVSRSDYKSEFDPKKLKSEKSGRGPLGPHWIDQLKKQRITVDGQHSNREDEPTYMCAYKLVTCKFKWFGLQNRVENMMHTQYRRLFTTFNREVFCWIDHWCGLTMNDIRALEDKTKADLDDMRHKGEIRGMKVEGEDEDE